LAVRQQTGIRLRERVREVAAPNFDRAENRMIAGFLHFLGLQIGDLRTRLQREMRLREERRAYRHRRGEEGGKSWWEAEDLPRIKSLPELYERWCVLEVMRCRRSCLRLGSPAAQAGSSPVRRLAEERERLVVEFAADQALDFEDAAGRLVRLRYVPRYRPWS